MTSGTFNATLTGTTSGLTVNQFYGTPPSTPGNVGVCLCGGGSRAMSAAMGQLRALSYLQQNNASLLSQVKAISTVSGGSWLGVTFEYLTSVASDAAYLNGYVSDQSQLVLTATAGHSQAETLDQLPDGNIGQSVSTDLFSLPGLGVAAYLLYKYGNVPANMLWQTLMGVYILMPYNLYVPGEDFAPTDLFSYDSATLSKQVTGPNPSLSGTTANLFADALDTSRTHRPFLICNTALLLTESGTSVQSLAPVQATAFMTGVVGSPTGTDADGRTPGGGGVTSFAFNSSLNTVDGSSVQVGQARQWSITDIVGTSSAAFAETLQNQFAEWEQNPVEFLRMLAEYAEKIWAWIKAHLPEDAHPQVHALASQAPGTSVAAETAGLQSVLSALQDIIPQYDYWPVANASPITSPSPTRFADGGSLENTGINGMLAYSDIDNIISFLNTETALVQGQYGALDSSGNTIPNTSYIVGSDLPPLFGYRPYDETNGGYILYSNSATNDYPAFANNQVFNSTDFPALLQGLWAAGGSGSNATSAIFQQSLAVQANKWFGIQGGNSITVLWVYLNRVQSWYDSLSQNVQTLIGSFTDPTSYSGFPNYSTLDTDLSATQINLLANLTAWNVASANASMFTTLFSSD